MEELFKANDKDLDDRLSWQEFCGEKTKSQTAFKLFDKDGDRKISKHVSFLVDLLRVHETCLELKGLGCMYFFHSVQNQSSSG